MGVPWQWGRGIVHLDCAGLCGVGPAIADPPPIFPKGRSPTYVKTINDAINQTSNLEGLLIIIEYEEYKQYLDNRRIKKDTGIGPKSNGEVKCLDDFTDEENPYDFLNEKEKGNILIIVKDEIDLLEGFEWATVITYSSVIKGFTNIVLRCTTSLYIVGEQKDYGEYDEHYNFPKQQVLQIIDFTGDEAPNGLLYQFKNYILRSHSAPSFHAHSSKFMRDFLLLKQCIESINNISMKDATENEKAFCVLKILEFMIHRFNEDASEENDENYHPEIYNDVKVIQSMSSQDISKLTLEDFREYVQKLRTRTMKKYMKMEKTLIRDQERLNLELISAMENVLNCQ